MSMGHFLDLNAQALGTLPPAAGAGRASLLLGPLASVTCCAAARSPTRRRSRSPPEPLDSCWPRTSALQTFAPVLSSAQLAEAIAPQSHADDLVVIHQEYEYGSTLGFDLLAAELPRGGSTRHRGAGRPTPPTPAELARVELHPIAVEESVHILTDASYKARRLRPQLQPLVRQLLPGCARDLRNHRRPLPLKWRGRQRIFLWQSWRASPARCPRALARRTSSPAPAAKRSSATSGTASVNR